MIWTPDVVILADAILAHNDVHVVEDTTTPFTGEPDFIA